MAHPLTLRLPPPEPEPPEPPDPPPDPPPESTPADPLWLRIAQRLQLTARQGDVLRLTLAGENQYAIAAALGVSVRCVQNHAAAIRRKHKLADPAAVARLVHELTLRFAVEDATQPLKAEIASLKAALAGREKEVAELAGANAALHNRLRELEKEVEGIQSGREEA